MKEQIHVIVYTNNDSSAEFLRASLGSDASESPFSLTLGDTSVELNVLEETNPAAFAKRVPGHDAVWVLARFVDQISLHPLRSLYALLAESAPGIPVTLSVVRKEAEQDFKMSCPDCGQMLWIRDSDTAKRGRCPNCRKGFEIPTQVDLLRRELNLPSDIDIAVMREANASCWQEELVRLISHSQMTPSGIDVRDVPEAEAAMNQTMVLEITSEMLDED